MNSSKLRLRISRLVNPDDYTLSLDGKNRKKHQWLERFTKNYQKEAAGILTSFDQIKVISNGTWNIVWFGNTESETVWFRIMDISDETYTYWMGKKSDISVLENKTLENDLIDCLKENSLYVEPERFHSLFEDNDIGDPIG